MIVGSLLLILVAVTLLVLGLGGGSSVLLIGSIVVSLLAAVALVVGARQVAAGRRGALSEPEPAPLAVDLDEDPGPAVPVEETAGWAGRSDDTDPFAAVPSGADRADPGVGGPGTAETVVGAGRSDDHVPDMTAADSGAGGDADLPSDAFSDAHFTPDTRVPPDTYAAGTSVRDTSPADVADAEPADGGWVGADRAGAERAAPEFADSDISSDRRLSSDRDASAELSAREFSAPELSADLGAAAADRSEIDDDPYAEFHRQHSPGGASGERGATAWEYGPAWERDTGPAFDAHEAGARDVDAQETGARDLAGDVADADAGQGLGSQERAAQGVPVSDGLVHDDDEDPADEPAPQRIQPADAVRVSQMVAEVLVVDGRPRYHLGDCPSLDGRITEPLPVGEAVELGFTPCSMCRPVDRLVTEAAHH